MRMCTADGCEKPAKGRTRYCSTHWHRMYRFGGLELPERETFASEPLVEIVEERGGPAACTTDPRLHRAYQRARAAGRVTTVQADRLALKMLGVHPWEVWPEWFSTGESHGTTTLIADG